MDDYLVHNRKGGPYARIRVRGYPLLQNERVGPPLLHNPLIAERLFVAAPTNSHEISESTTRTGTT